MAVFLDVGIIQFLFVFFKVEILCQLRISLIQNIIFIFLFKELFIKLIPSYFICFFEGFQLCPALFIDLLNLVLVRLDLMLMDLGLLQVQFELGVHALVFLLQIDNLKFQG